MKRAYLIPNSEQVFISLTSTLLAMSKLNSNVQQGGGESLAPIRFY